MDMRVALAGMSSLYRGLIGAASGAGIAIGAYFAVYGVACNALSRHTDLSPGMVAFVGGGAAALGSSVVKVPLAVCIRSVQAGVYPNVFNAASSILKAVGTRGLFTGYAPTVLEDVPDMAIKFAAYEGMRQAHAQMYPGRKPSPQEDFAMGAVAGAAAAAATTPLDVIKTNMMINAAQRPSMSSAAAIVYAQAGPKAFFRGVGARALSNGINSAVFFCFFESIRGTLATTHKLIQQERAEGDVARQSHAQWCVPGAGRGMAGLAAAAKVAAARPATAQ
jgi:solute carrier family 25 S-adenosylmethionine transporter 26